MSTNIGQLRERVALVTHGHTSAPNGRPIITEVGRQMRWAKIEDRTGAVSFVSQIQQFSYDYKITLWHFQSVPTSEKQTIEYKGKKMSIKAIQIVSEGSRVYEVLRCAITSK